MKAALRVVVVSCFVLCGPGQGTKRTSTTVGFWNLDCLGCGGAFPHQVGSPGESQNVIEIAGMIRDLNWDIGVLSRVGNAGSALDDLREQLHGQGYQTASPSEGGIPPLFFYRPGVARLLETNRQHAPSFIVLSGDCSANRVGSNGSATFEIGGHRIVIFGIELNLDLRSPASRCQDPGLLPEIRRRQTLSVLQELRSTWLKNDANVVIVGEVGDESSSPSFQAFREAGFSDLTDSGDLDPKSGLFSLRSPTGNERSARILASPSMRMFWLTGSSMYEPAYSNLSKDDLRSWQTSLSSFAPVWTTFSVEDLK